MWEAWTGLIEKFYDEEILKLWVKVGSICMFYLSSFSFCWLLPFEACASRNPHHN